MQALTDASRRIFAGGRAGLTPNRFLRPPRRNLSWRLDRAVTPHTSALHKVLASSASRALLLGSSPFGDLLGASSGPKRGGNSSAPEPVPICADETRVKTGSVGGMTAVDAKDVTGDEAGFVGRDEHDAIGDFLGEAEARLNGTCEARAALFSAAPVKRVSMPASG